MPTIVGIFVDENPKQLRTDLIWADKSYLSGYNSPII